MTTKLPTQVKVGAMTYTVEVVPELFENKSLYGEVTYADQRISIAGDCSPARQVNALIHELTHAILFESGDCDMYHDEEFVRRLANMLTQVAVDNDWRVTE
jgi:Zn-dependent peptidase ImmA (M78 family)